MKWARAAIVLGVLLVVTSFGFGTGVSGSVRVAGDSYECGVVIPSSWFDANVVPAGHVTGTPAERRLAAQVNEACSSVETTARWMVWGGIGLGALLLLVGITVLSERDRDAHDSDQENAKQAIPV